MLKKFFKDWANYYAYIDYAAKSELVIEISESYLGWIWWLLEPLCFMVIYMFVFGYMFQSKVANFPLFIFIGITIWNFFNKNLLSSIGLVNNNKHILNKVYLPKFTLVLKKMYVNGFKMLVSFMIIAIALVGFKIKISLNILWILPQFFLLFVFTFGICNLVLHLSIYIKDLEKVINIFLRVLFFLSGVFYSLEERLAHVSKNFSVILLKLNPIAFMISGFRNALIHARPVNYKWYLAWLIFSLIMLYLSLYIIYKYEKKYMKVV